MTGREPVFILLAITVCACVPSGHTSAPEAAPGLRTSCAGVASNDTTVYDSTQITEPPVFRTMPKPTYPEDALRRKVQGRVVVTAIANADGTIDQGSIAIAEGVDPLLDAEARRIMGGATLWPACRNGVAVRTQMTVPVQFSVRSGVSEGVLIGVAAGVMGGVMVLMGTQ